MFHCYLIRILLPLYYWNNFEPTMSRCFWICFWFLLFLMICQGLEMFTIVINCCSQMLLESKCAIQNKAIVSYPPSIFDQDSARSAVRKSGRVDVEAAGVAGFRINPSWWPKQCAALHWHPIRSNSHHFDILLLNLYTMSIHGWLYAIFINFW